MFGGTGKAIEYNLVCILHLWTFKTPNIIL